MAKKTKVIGRTRAYGGAIDSLDGDGIYYILIRMHSKQNKL